MHSWIKVNTRNVGLLSDENHALNNFEGRFKYDFLKITISNIVLVVGWLLTS